MARTPDKPGTFRVKQKGGQWIVSAVNVNGTRARMAFSSEEQAQSMGAAMAGTGPIPTVRSMLEDGPAVTKPQTVQLDDFGLPITPVLGEDTLRAVGASMGVSVQSSTPPPKPLDPDKQLKAKQRAKTICEFLGVGIASADVWVARKLTKSIGKDPVNPSAKQVAGLAVAWQDAMNEIIADRTIGPWTMAILLSLALPASMMLQSPKSVAPPEEKEPGLKAVG